jgi:hypothetical protein
MAWLKRIWLRLRHGDWIDAYDAELKRMEAEDADLH